MADSALPTTGSVNTAQPAPTRMGNSSDTSWAGWAISSFTNTITTAKGEMQPIIDGSTSLATNNTRPISAPGSTRATAETLLFLTSDSTVQTAQQLISTNTQAAADAEPEDALEAWGAMEEEEDSFFDAPSSRTRSPKPQPASKYDDEGEPDFAGWLAAQSQAKSKKPLPKGMTKSSNARPSLADRTISTGTMGSEVGAKKLSNTTSKPKVTVPVKRIDTKPKETEQIDEGWGDDWD